MTASLRKIEFSEHSQNGEDGIIDYLLPGVRRPNRTFVEFGCGNGKENNTTRLAKLGWRGLAIDAKHRRVLDYRRLAYFNSFGHRVIAKHAWITTKRVHQIEWPHTEPDLFSLDIDGIDFHIMREMIKLGIRPAICCLEYNATLGRRSVTVPYNETFVARPVNLYYGASVAAWRAMMEPRCYRFVTVDSAGVNCFFVNTMKFDLARLDGVHWIDWADCRSFCDSMGMDADERFRKIAHMQFQKVKD